MSFNIDLLVRENVKALKPYSSARDEYSSNGSEMIFLDANENPFETEVNRYPDPQQKDLKRKLGELKEVSEEKILLGNGSDEVLDLLFRAFCEPGRDNVITLPPTYGMYDVLANINNVENKQVLLTSDFQPDLPGIFENVDENTKLIFICSPNNPTGNSINQDAIVELLRNFNGLVVIDEAYIDFSQHKSQINLLNDYPNLVVTQTLSKAYGMAGIRLGICYASKEIIRILNKIKPPYNINILTQNYALNELNEINNYLSQVSDIKVEKKRLFKVLDEIEFIEEIYPSDANFILVKVDNANKRYSELLVKGIVIRNRTTQALCENTLRFTVGTKTENDQLITALKEII